MKKQLFVCGVSTLLIALCGCGPQLAQSHYGTEEEQWARGIAKSYPGYCPPRVAPPAIVDNVSPRLVEAEENQVANVEAVESVEVIPEAVSAPAAEAPAEDPKAENTAAETKDAAAPAPAAPETKAEVKADDNLEFTFYTVKAGDSLSKIAKEFYGDARKYDIIIKANGITDPAKVRIGTKLQIPKL